MPNQNAAPFSGQLSVATFPNKYSVVVPPEAPFYRIGLELTRKNGTPLVEGLDYYLGYYFDELSKAEGDSIYGGIMLLNETEVNYKLLATGRENRVPMSVIGKFLVDVDIKDPRNVDWTALMNYAPVISPIDPPKDIHEAILRDEIVKALEDLRLAIAKQSSDLDAVFDDIRNNIKTVGNRVFTEEYYQHHLVKNAHNVTAEDLGALSVLGRAVDATKAYGRTLAEIADVMSTAGVNAKRLAQILGFNGGNLYGRVEVIGTDTLEFKSSDGLQFIRIKGPEFTIGSTNNPLNIVADKLNANPGIAVEMSCGLNTLWVHSGPDVKAPVFNGEYLITPDMVKLYLTSAQIRPANAYFESTDNVKIYGTGKQSTPMRIEVTIPNATDTVPGAFAVTDISTYPGMGFAISQKAVTAIKGMLDNYVSDTFTINGQRFVNTAGKQQLTLTAANFNIERVNNTAPMDKPVTKAISTALAQKALVTHTHDFSDLTGVPIASEVVSGLVQLHDAVDATTDKAVTSKQGFLLNEKIKRIEAATDSMMPEWVGGSVAYGNNTFLPPAAVGSYDGYARNNKARAAAVFFQEGRMYALANYHNGTPETRGIFYIHAEVSAAGVMAKPTKTNIRYRPVGMNGFPGIELAEVHCAGPNGMVAKGTDDLYYLVPFNGTVDQSKHVTVCRLTLPNYVDDANAAGKSFVFDPASDKLESMDGDFYIIRTDLVGHSQLAESRFRVGVYKIAGADIAAGQATATQLTLQFANISGKCADLVKPGVFADAIGAGDMMAYYTPAGKAKWTSWAATALGSTRNIVTTWEGNKLRVSVNCQTAAFDDTVGTQFGWWTYAYDVDVTTSVVTGMSNIFPIKIDADGFYYSTGTKMTRGPKWAGITSGSLITTRCKFGDRVYSYIYNVSIPVVPALALQQLPAGDFGSFLDSQTDGVTTHQEPVEDSVGSVYPASMTAPLFIPGLREVWVNHIHNSLCVRAKYSTTGSYRVPGYNGFGPTNDRSVVSWDDYSTLANIPMVVNRQRPNGVLDGAFFSGPKSAPYLVPYGTSVPQIDRLELVEAEWNKLKDMIAATAQAGAAVDNRYESLIQSFTAGPARYTLGLWIVGTGMESGPLCVATVVATKAVAGSATYTSNVYAFQVFPTIAAGKVTFPQARAVRLGYQLDMENDVRALNSNWDNQRASRPSQSYLLSRDDSKYRLCLGNIARTSNVSGERALSIALNLTRTAGDYAGWLAMHLSQLLYSNPICETYCRDLGSIVRLSNSIDPVYLSGYTLSDALITDITVSVDNVIVAGVQTANDWMLYFTEPTKFKLDSTEYTVPVTTIDLQTALSDYRNQKIYVYVSVDAGATAAKYTLSLTRLQNTKSMICIGTVTTDNDRITSIQVDNVKSLGAIQEINEHAGIADAHLWSSERELNRSPWALLTEKWVNGPAANGMLNAGALEDLVTDQKSQKVFTKSVTVDGSYVPYGYMDFSASFMLPGTTTAPAADETWLQTNGLLWTGLNSEATGYDSSDTYRTIRFRANAPGVVGTQLPLVLEFVTPYTADVILHIVADNQTVSTPVFSGIAPLTKQTVNFNAASGKTVWVTMQIKGTADDVHNAIPKNVAYILKSGADVIHRSNYTVYAAPSADCPEPTENAVDSAIMVLFENLPNGNFVPMVSVDAWGVTPIVRCTYYPNDKAMEVYVPVIYSLYKKVVKLKQVDVMLLPMM